MLKIAFEFKTLIKQEQTCVICSWVFWYFAVCFYEKEIMLERIIGKEERRFKFI